jgi:tRNA (guanine9-N1)-methyltransferase
VKPLSGKSSKPKKKKFQFRSIDDFRFALPLVNTMASPQEQSTEIEHELANETQDNQSKIRSQQKIDYNDPKYAGMSKRAVKRLLKQELWEATKDERRQAFKDKKKRKREEDRKLIEQGLLEPRASPKRIKPEEQEWSKMNVVIDCEFNSYMVEKEINSMQTQIMRCYSANKSSKHPCPMTVTSFGGDLEAVFDKKTPSKAQWKGIDFVSESYLDKFDKDKLVYLSADSDNVAHELDESKVYIIGGIVDKNRHKGLCQDKASKQGIPTVQLPIGEHLQMASRKVLTVNHGKTAFQYQYIVTMP